MSPGLWQHPDDESYRFTNVNHWVELAKTLEEAKFHGIFIADVLGRWLAAHALFPRELVSELTNKLDNRRV